MGSAKDDGRGRDRTVAVVDGEVPATGWHMVDLHRSLDHGVGAIPDPSVPGRGAPPVWSVSTTVVSPVRLPIVSAGSVPASAFVKVGRSGRFGKRGARVIRDAGRASANDNVAAANPGGRSVWRDLLFLAILAATVIGAFWSGRVHGLQRVIVVPAPSSFHSVIT